MLHVYQWSTIYLLQILITLNLGNNQIEDAGAQAIAQALENNQVRYTFSFFNSIIILLYSLQTLTVLNLSSNKIGYAGARALAQALKNNQVRYTFSFFTSISGTLYTYYSHSPHSISREIPSNMQINMQLLEH